jgi:hypothetical protein
MSLRDLKSTLLELHQALARVETVDPELRDLLLRLDQDIHGLTDPDATVSANYDYSGKLSAFEAQFAAGHPQLSGMFRALLTTLEHVGI